MMKIIFAGMALVMMAMPGYAQAESQGVAVGIKASTLGAGLELTAPINDSFNVRALLSGFNYSRNGTRGQIAYDAKLKLATGGALVDYYPGGNNIFRLTAGGFINGNKLNMTGKPTGGNYTVNNTLYTAAQVGSAAASVKFNTLSPYIGIGLGNPVSEGSNWGFNVEAGAMYQGKPKVTLTASGAAANATLAADIAQEQIKLANTLKNYRWYPVLGFGISYRF